MAEEIKDQEKVSELSDSQEDKPKIEEEQVILDEVVFSTSFIETLYTDNEALEDSDVEVDNILLDESDYNYSREELYKFLVKKINSFGGIRKVHKLFRDKRRSLIDFENPSSVIPDEYYILCADFIP